MHFFDQIWTPLRPFIHLSTILEQPKAIQFSLFLFKKCTYFKEKSKSCMLLLELKMTKKYLTKLYLIGSLILTPACLSAIEENFSPPLFPLTMQELYHPKLKQADDFFDAGLFLEANQLYQQLLDQLIQNPTENRSNLIAKVQFNLAQTCLAMEKYHEVIAILNHLDEEEKELKLNSYYLIGLAQSRLKNYEKAIQAFTNYLDRITESTPLYNETHFEIGLAYFEWKKSDQAKKYFEILDIEASNPRLHALSQLYLAKIALLNNQHNKAINLLAKLEKPLSQDILKYELAYLQGEAHYEKHDYEKAISYFEKALPTQIIKCSWRNDTLYLMGWSYLKLADVPLLNAQQQSQFYDKAESFFKLLATNEEERAFLALGQTYLSRAKKQKNAKDYALAESLLSNTNHFKTPEAQAHALLLRAEAAMTYEARDLIYRELTQNQHYDNSFYAKGWFMRGLNDFENGQSLQTSTAARISYEKAVPSFKKAFELFKDNDNLQAGISLKYQALALSHIDDQAAFDVIDTLINHFPEQLKEMNGSEVYYLHGFLAVRLAEKDDQFFQIAKQSLQKAVDTSGGDFGDQALIHLGSLYYLKNDYASAEVTFLQLVKSYPSSLQCGEALFWSANCADKLGQPHLAAQRRKQVFENYSASPFAAEAYFIFYSYQDYLQGDRAAIKHLQAFAKKYPGSIFLIEANYLIGLDFKRDRKTPEGKWLRKKSLTEAIDAFQEVETTFDHLYAKNAIPADKLDFYIAIRYQAILERALTNLAIANDSQGAKRQIYLDYAEGVFKRLVDDFNSNSNPFKLAVSNNDPYPPLFQESSYWLAETYVKGQNDSAAETVLHDIIKKYQTANITKNYYLSRARYLQADIAIRKKEYAQALQLLKYAEDAGKGNLLSTDQKLDLWIQQSLCYRGMNQFDNAILILSKVINDDAISSLRLKAMLLRAETYEQQGRPELARKQLESMAKKGGTWALKAKIKLEKEYGY